MKIVFFGNTKYSLIGARKLHYDLDVSLIVTIPDRPDKRGHLVPSPLKSFAQEHKIPVLETNKLTDQIIQKIAEVKPDFLVVEDYGLILPETLLDAPKYASLNIHHSLLPKYRGTSPAPTAIFNGDSITGVTVIKMAEKVDAGDILAQKKYSMKPDETTDSLLTILNDIGAKLLVEAIKNFDKTESKPQDEEKATFTKMMKKQDGFIHSNNPPTPEMLDRMIRAYYPWPTVWTKIIINGKEKIMKFLPEKRLQVEGKNPMSMQDFFNGYPELKETIKKITL